MLQIGLITLGMAIALTIFYSEIRLLQKFEG